MTRPYIISTDTASDISEDFAKVHRIPLHPLHYLIDGKEYGMELGELSPHNFYQCMREGKMPTTNATNPDYDRKLMEDAVNEGYDILHLSFSSTMSGSYNNAALAANQILEKHPDAKIIVIDTLSATSGMCYLIEGALRLREEGKSLEETAKWVEETSPHIVVHFTVPDLFHLMRGGRLNRTSAVVGTALKIQPILHVSDKGGLENIKKVRGRATALRTLAREVGDLIDAGRKPDSIYITHGDCESDARELAETLRREYGIEKITINYLSPTLGAHAGPGTIAIGYLGITR